MKLVIHNFDGNPPSGAPEPLEVLLLKQLSATDGSEYWLAELSQSIIYKTDGKEQEVSHIIVGAGISGTSFNKSFQNSRVNVAYVTDQAALTSEELNFAHADYVAIGIGSIQ